MAIIEVIHKTPTVTTTEQLLEILQKNPQGLTIKQLSMILNRPVSLLQICLKQLIKQRSIVTKISEQQQRIYQILNIKQE